MNKFTNDAKLKTENLFNFIKQLAMQMHPVHIQYYVDKSKLLQFVTHHSATIRFFFAPSC